MSGANPYEVLGVAREATQDEVRAAYFRLVREHTPEDSPERFQAISEAYRVLSDPDARKALDADLGVPPDVAEALREAAELLEKDPPAAARRALRALEVPGRSAEVRFAVAATCLRAGAAASAVPLLEALVREDPRAGARQHALGEAYAATNRPKEAEAAYRAAMAVAPDQRAPYAALAELLDSTGRGDEALRTLRDGRRATNPSGAPDPRDLEILFPEFIVHARAGRTAESRRVLTDVRRTVPPGDPAAAQHIGIQVAMLGDRFADARHYDVAHLLMEEAHAIAPLDAIRERMTELGTIAKQHRAALGAAEDPAVAKWIRELIALRVGKPLAEPEFRDALDGIVLRLASRLRHAEVEWRRFEMNWAAAAAYVKDLRDAVMEGARRAAAPGPLQARVRRVEARVDQSPWLRAAVIVAFTLFMAFVVHWQVTREASPRRKSGATAPLPWDDPVAMRRSVDELAKKAAQDVHDRLRRRLGRDPTPEEYSAELRGILESTRDALARERTPFPVPRVGTR